MSFPVILHQPLLLLLCYFYIGPPKFPPPHTKNKNCFKGSAPKQKWLPPPMVYMYVRIQLFLVLRPDSRLYDQSGERENEFECVNSSSEAMFSGKTTVIYIIHT